MNLTCLSKTVNLDRHTKPKAIRNIHPNFNYKSVEWKASIASLSVKEAI